MTRSGTGVRKRFNRGRRCYAASLFSFLHMNGVRFVMQVFCPYCNNEAKLVDSAIIYRGVSYGDIWLCKPCDAYNGVHPDGYTAHIGGFTVKQCKELVAKVRYPSIAVEDFLQGS